MIELYEWSFIVFLISLFLFIHRSLDHKDDEVKV